MARIIINKSIDLGAKALQSALTRTADHLGLYDPITLPVGKAGELTTRTDADTGTITMVDADHGITTGMIVDIHWTVAGVDYVQYGVTVGTVSGTSVPFDAGAGDDLPVLNSDVVVTPHVTVNTQVDGDNAKVVVLHAATTDVNLRLPVHVDLQDSGGNTIAELDLVTNVTRTIDIEGGDTNLFTGNPITATKATNGSDETEVTLTIASLEDSTP